LLRKGGCDALLITHLPNVLYLCGFTGTAGVLLFQVSDRGHKVTFYTDGRYDQQAHDEVQSAKVVVGRKAAFTEACEGAQKAKVRTLGFEADHLSYSAYKQMGMTVRGKIRLKPSAGLVEQLRLIKDAGWRKRRLRANWSCRRDGLERRKCHSTRLWPRGRVPHCRMGARRRNPFLRKDLLSWITVLYSQVTVPT
jgi:Xaa-Pro aminopeptidase